MVARCGPTPVLDLVEEPFNQVACAVERYFRFLEDSRLEPTSSTWAAEHRMWAHPF
jgi:hypothetical protein